MRRLSSCVLLLIGIVTVGCGDKSSKPPESTPAVHGSSPAASPAGRGPAATPVAHGSAAAPVALGPGALKTTAEALTKELLADEKAAQAKYNGKVVELEGEVSFANKIITSKGFSLKGAKRKPTDTTGVIVSCSVPNGGEGKAWRLSSGQKVKVVGTATLSSSVYLAKCTVEPLEPATTAKVTAKGLVEEIIKDAEAAKKKYQSPEGYSKEIIVEGVVAALERNKNGNRIAKLTGADGITVNCTMDDQDYATLKVGDTVTIKGDFSSYYADEKAAVVDTAFVLPKE